MTEFFGNWMYTIAGTALICSAALSLTPAGKVKSVLQLTSGLLLICAMLTPVIRGDTPELSMSLARYRSEAAQLTDAAQKKSNELSRTIIEAELKAYILDKARELEALPQELTIEMSWSTEGFWYPDAVRIDGGGLGALGKSRLENLIEAELGIPAQRQYWEENGN